MARVGKRPSAGTVLGFVAVVLAMTGTAIAATSITSSKQIKNGVVTSADIKNRTIKSRDIAKGTVKALRGKTGAAGPRGLNGLTGATGPAGPVPANEAYRTVGAAGQPPFLLDWANFNSVDRQVAQFRKDRDGRVFLRGVVGRAADTTASRIFTLPVGYRPPKAIVLDVPTATGLGTFDEFGAIEITPDGGITLYGQGDDRFVDLTGVSFDAF